MIDLYWSASLGFDERPASLSWSCGAPWSIYLSGSVIAHTIWISLSYLKNTFLRLFWTQFTLSFSSERPFKLTKLATCVPNPPIDPSSMVSKTSCSLANLLINYASNGLQNRASATVAYMLCAWSKLAAPRHCLRLNHILPLLCVWLKSRVALTYNNLHQPALLECFDLRI